MQVIISDHFHFANKKVNYNIMNVSKENFRCGCPITSALDIIGDSWTIVIVKQMLLANKHTFKELYESDESIASNILSSRLKHLEKYEILTKEKLPHNKKTNIYRLTNKGILLAPIIVELAIWGEANLKEFNAEIGENTSTCKVQGSKEEFIKEIKKNYQVNSIKCS